MFEKVNLSLKYDWNFLVHKQLYLYPIVLSNNGGLSVIYHCFSADMVLLQRWYCTVLARVSK